MKITTIATTNDNDIDDNDDIDEARRATFNAGHVDAPAREKLPRAFLDGVLKFKTESRRDGVEQATTTGCKVPIGDSWINRFIPVKGAADEACLVPF